MLVRKQIYHERDWKVKSDKARIYIFISLQDKELYVVIGIVWPIVKNRCLMHLGRHPDVVLSEKNTVKIAEYLAW